MRVLALTRYGRLGASSRMRSYQYLPVLEAAGIQIEVAPLFSEAYVRGLQEGRRKFGDVVAAYAGRVRALRRAPTFDLLWIEKDPLPWLPARQELALMPSRTPIVLDYDDAVFHRYDQHRSALVRRLLDGKHPALMRRSALVVAGNDYIADYARSAGAPEVTVLPTVIDLARYPTPRADAGENGIPTVGWIGQRITASFLTPLACVFKILAAEGIARFAAIGIDTVALDLPMASVPWTEASEVDSISRLNIGIMPLVDGPFERGKCGYKLIQYMACGLPVVASPVGVNCQIVEHGVNGFLASTPEEWATALRNLATDATLRRRMGAAGRSKVEREYSLQMAAPRLAEILKSAVR